MVKIAALRAELSELEEQARETLLHQQLPKEEKQRRIAALAERYGELKQMLSATLRAYRDRAEQEEGAASAHELLAKALREQEGLASAQAEDLARDLLSNPDWDAPDGAPPASWPRL